jgi:hypothetical protein
MEILDLIQRMKIIAVDDTISLLGIQTSPKKVVTCFRTVLRKLPGGALCLLRDPRLQIAVLPYSIDDEVVFAYFPVHRRRKISKFVDLRSTTRILLWINAPRVESLPSKSTEEALQHHFGHVLFYLRKPQGSNECTTADREWGEWSQITNSLAV